MNASVDSEGTTDNDSDNGENLFISKLLGEMKNKFNKTDDTKSSPPVQKLENSSTNQEIQEIEVTTDNSSLSTSNMEECNIVNSALVQSDEEIKQEEKIEQLTTTAEGNEVEEDVDGKPRIVLLFKKPSDSCSSSSVSKTKKVVEEVSSSTTSNNNNRRSLRSKSNSVEERADESTTLKRSARRRSKDCNESVLQSAIARKEKSYNESSQPQRLTRTLKPTQKILENLAQAKQEKYKSEKVRLVKDNKASKSYDSDSNNDILNSFDGGLEEEKVFKKKKTKYSKESTKKTKRMKSAAGDSDSESGSNQEAESAKESAKNARRSQRISSSYSRNSKEDVSMEIDDEAILEPNTAEQSSIFPAAPECSSVGAQLIASRLCLCTQKTSYYPADTSTTINEDDQYCAAIDGIGDKLVGCTKIVDKETPLLRPSHRVPFALFCDTHKNRMIRHNCCPSCGVFCTQGRFTECESKHQYHRACQISVGEKECCPHCGSSTPEYDVFITMHSPKKPVFLPVQKPQSHTAKLSFYGHADNTEEDNNLIPPLPNGTVELLNASELEGQIFSINELFDAIKDNDIERLAIILGSRSIDLYTKITDFDDGTLLHFTAQHGLLTIVHMLVIVGMEPDIFDKEQNTPLMLAITAEKNDVVQYLIKAGASIELKGTDGMTSLHLASKCGNLKACEIIVSSAYGIKNFINNQDDGGWTPLVWACEHGFLDIARFLISKGADPQLRDVEHNVALHWAAFSGNASTAELLLNNNCDVNSTNAHGDTPLHIGARQDMYNCIIVLLARGANISIINNNNETPLDCVPPGSDSYGIISLNVQLQALTLPGVEKQKIILTNDISKGREFNPIQCVNLVDDEPLPTDFVYITKNCITSDNISIDNKITSLQSCLCEDRCNTEDCLCTKAMKYWYDEEGKLIPEFDFTCPPEIFECNEACTCNMIICNNRVVQRGLTQRFQLYKTDNKGWGIKTLCSIKRGSFVCEYIGELLTEYESSLRDEDSYVFNLDSKDENSFCIDSKNYGNFSRFLNHSCEANLVPVKVFAEHQDLQFPKVVFYACKDIEADEELCFNYGEKFWEVKIKSFSCACGSTQCRYSGIFEESSMD